MTKLKWEKVKHAPIPDYNSTDGRWRLYRSTVTRMWHLQDRHSPDHPEPVAYTDTFAAAKAEAGYLVALTDFNVALANTPPADVEAARNGCGLLAARFACTYAKPEKNQAPYNRIYNIFWDYYHPTE